MVKAALTVSEECGFSVAGMTGRTTIDLLSLVALLGGVLAMPAAAPAQCRLCRASTTEGSESIGEPVRIEVQTRLDFDQLVLLDASSAGTARLLPDGTASTSGAIGVLSGRAMVGRVLVRGEPGRMVRVGLPGGIRLYGLTGSSIRLDALVTDLPAEARLDAEGMLRFRFGGSLHVEGNAEGEYRGDVPITVDYL
jgi:hypothetical protein